MTDRYKKKCATPECQQITIGKHCKHCSIVYRRNRHKEGHRETGDTPAQAKLRRQTRAALMHKVRYEDAAHVR